MRAFDTASRAWPGGEHWQIPLQIRRYRRRHDHNANLEAFWSLLAERFEHRSHVFP